MKKVGVFLGDHFWSSAPYDGLNLYHKLSSQFETDLIVFKDDIRINKQFDGSEKYFFHKHEFFVENLKVIKDWAEIKRLSSDYSLIICQTKIAPKTRFPFDYNTRQKPLNCPIAVWDVGGCDILHDSPRFADYFFVKGPIWKEWMHKMGFSEDKVFTTGSPHYDYFFDSSDNVVGSALSKEQFLKKYSLQDTTQKIVLMPTNPASHKEQFEDNFRQLDKIVDLSHKNNVQLLVKTYPHDYVFGEKEGPYTGIYKRKYANKPQYQVISDRYPSIKVVDSQDHHSCLMHVDKVFNMAGSHVAWETFYTRSTSYAMGYKDKKYYKQIPVLKHFEFIEFPDDIMNIDMEQLSDIVYRHDESKKRLCEKYFLNESSMSNICNSVEKILVTNDK